MLASLGVTPLPGRVIDPGAGALEGDTPGASPVVSAYAEHPVTRGLDANRMTFFRGARSFALKKASPDDRLRAVVFSSGSAWIETTPSPEACSASTLPQGSTIIE